MIALFNFLSKENSNQIDWGLGVRVRVSEGQGTNHQNLRCICVVNPPFVETLGETKSL